MRSERLGVRRLAAVAGAALALISGGAGCATVPTGGSPRAAQEDHGKDTLSQPYVRLIATRPKKGASPEDIVKGFQAAMAAFDDRELSVARDYLTPGAAKRWNPWGQTRIYEGKIESDHTQDLRKATRTTVTLKGTAVATIDPDGRSTPASGPFTEPFTLVKVDGEWRIDGLPDARLLSNDDLQRAYRRVDLYYPPATRESGLVVDRVWVPIEPSRGVPETLVRRLLAGPTSSIRNAVSSAFPPGTGLNRITVEGDTVVIDFSAALESVPPDRLDALKAQLVWTLGELVTGRTVEIRVNGETGPRFRPADYAGYDPNVLTGSLQAFYMQGGRLLQFKEKGDGTPVPGAAGEQAGKFTQPAVSGTDRFPPLVAALLNGDGVYVAPMAPGSQWQRWIAGKDMSPPSWDRYGAVWSAERVNSHESRVWTADNGRAHEVDIDDELSYGRIVELRVSRDGARVAAIVDNGLGTSVKIGTIVRNGQQTRIEAVRTLIEPRDARKIKDIAWQDAADLLVLSEGSSGQELTTWSVMEGIIPNDGPIKLDSKIKSIAAVPDHVLAEADEGQVLAYSMDKHTWTPRAENGATNPVYPLG
ncbi:lipoprotein LpqB [Microbispora rosea subsp. aerata]|nr:LpqB family beta-propeller domain-containing protein [Microbispora rosea]GGO12313.1 lipoprotein LpqB [Microbispora rosea subsp. aerata]GIH58629.1 lipoprotein LpqB [Microbispora rosea subsp. aerata]GLJ84689.1 lipoprotein LpqB [Microbispora rosea subsp. aerata]